MHSTNHNSTRVIVGMSGGVDSSVSAWLLQKQGYQVEGLFMKNWEEDDDNNHCTSAADLADAQIVCDKLGINLHKVNFSTEYWDNVFEHFLKEYKRGRTPNPDILCNKEIKFKTFLDFALSELNASYIATGHYARSENINGNRALLRGLDSNKDQSYFLYTLSQELLRRCLFPVGGMNKVTVRNIAEEIGLPNAKKKDSTGICFIGQKKFCNFLQRYLPGIPGKIKNTHNQVIGTHKGSILYTLGQRRGLGIGGVKHTDQNPWYVVEKNILNNELIVAQDSNHPKLLSNRIVANQVNWVNGFPQDTPLYCTAKIRYRHKDVPCKVLTSGDSIVEISFDKCVTAATPGQSIVFYSGQYCLGGGVIDSYWKI